MVLIEMIYDPQNMCYGKRRFIHWT